uniref:Recep_L_domain domain-containing protein n=1 Tax=Strongyloides papillosus TaxID=174720 RepID=A0A0N5BTN3_STREA
MAFEKYVHCMLTGNDVNAVIQRWRVTGVPKRGMVFHEYCPPLLAFSTDRRLKHGRICPKECLEWVNGRRNGPLNAAAIKVVMYQEPQYTSVVAALNKQRATLLDINFAMPGCRKLLIDSIVETLKVRPLGICNNLDFLASAHVKALYWDGNSNITTRGVLTAFPNLAVIVYRDCKFTRSVQLPGSIRIIICCTRICQCNLGKIRGWQRPYSVKCGPNVIGGPASLYFKTKEDFLCFGDYSGVSRRRHTQDV